MGKGLANLTLIHYYDWKTNGKPWNLNRLRKYEEAGYPDYHDLNHPFWRNEWQRNPLSFCVWYKYNKEFETAKNQAQSIGNAINIVFISDYKYFDYTYTALLSILENSKPEERKERLNFNVIVDEPSFKEKEQPDWIRMYSNAMYTKYNKDAYKYEIVYRAIPEEEMQFISQFSTGNWPKSTNLKLSFSRFLPYDRCLYLDADIACTNDIKLLWNTDLGTHCVGSCEHDHLLCGREIGVHNGGVMLMDLKKMREYKFTEESAELLKNGKRPGQGRRKMGQWLLYTEEDAFEEYSEKHPDLGILNVDLSFNMCCYFMPREFLGNNAEALVEKIPGMNNGLSNLTLIHYYTVNGVDSKPWSHNRLQKYEEARCPSYYNLNHPFWRNEWQCNPLSFCVWYKYNKEFETAKKLHNQLLTGSIPPPVKATTITSGSSSSASTSVCTSVSSNAINIAFIRPVAKASWSH